MNYLRTPTTHTARKDHKCIACMFFIPAGDIYRQQTGYSDGKAFRDRYHPECFQTVSGLADEFLLPGCIPPPTRIYHEYI